MRALRKKMALAALPVVVAGGALVFLRPWDSEGATPPAPTNRGGGSPTLIAVGDIGRCGQEVDEATAAIVEGLPDTTVLALGDLAYTDGTAEQFEECYDPSWGPFVDRTRPVP